MCMCVCVLYTYVFASEFSVCAQMKVRGWSWCLYCSPPYVLRQDISLRLDFWHLGYTGWPVKSWVHCLCLSVLSYRSWISMPGLYVDVRVPNSGSPFTYWAISPASQATVSVNEQFYTKVPQWGGQGSGYILYASLDSSSYKHDLCLGLCL